MTEASRRIVALALTGLRTASSAVLPYVITDEADREVVVIGSVFITRTADKLLVEALANDMNSLRELCRFPLNAEFDAAHAAVMHVVSAACARAMERHVHQLARGGTKQAATKCAAAQDEVAHV